MAAVAEAPPRSFPEIEHLYCGSVYPGPRFFEGCETALCLFSAMWWGRQDVYWLAKAGLTGTCVDLNGERLSQMAAVYPAGWEFVQDDVFEYAKNAGALGTERQWDVVTLDPWTGQFQQCADLMWLWCALARRVVVLGHGNYRLTAPKAPEGWEHVETFRRSDFKGGVNWLVYTRA